MNCKPGNLAVIVRASMEPELLGRIVTVTTISPWFVIPHWRTDPPLRMRGGDGYWVVPDYCLRPLRDNDGEDEILRIAGKPQPVSV
jgi:hypothetical protein